MVATKRAWVFSDIHLGPDGPLGVFRDGEALGLAWKSIAAGEPVGTELILAGDVFDFCKPWTIRLPRRKAPDPLRDGWRHPSGIGSKFWWHRSTSSIPWRQP